MLYTHDVSSEDIEAAGALIAEESEVLGKKFTMSQVFERTRQIFGDGCSGGLGQRVWASYLLEFGFHPTRRPLSVIARKGKP